MFYIRIFVILVITILALTATDSFAATGSTMIGSGSVTSKITDIQKDETIITENSIEDRKKEQNAQKIILEVYKLQGSKILKDMDISIEKINPNPKVRIDVYSGIQKTLEFRKQKLEKSEMSPESKDILTGYIEYMISTIEKRKKTLE